MSIFEKNAFSRKFQNFLNYRLALFCKIFVKFAHQLGV
ncbi:hypothetical protein T4A_5767 [Trichinella pseudospiralis]|uniref:Uncharacterized protein n=1 Tax=Trichinella pseudospiralis TaxID=6337 RepID=A0A0V1C5N6_TRIPS|nr:hypothetical protein T4A_5767 [Trichinella pseudospiralis]